ncbi:MAG: GDSL-like Lipase/Acylhydrolase family [Pseudomonadota bacterium]
MAALTYAAVRVTNLAAPPANMAIVQTAAARCVALLIGDSGIARWPLRPAPGWQYRRLGAPGATTAAIAGPARAAIAAARANLIVINAGGNDAAGIAFLRGERRHAEIARSAARVAALARAGQASGARVVVLGLVPPAHQPWWRALLIGGRQGAAMAAIEAATVLPAGVTRIDTSALIGADGRSDHVHFTPAAYARIDAALAPYRALACPVQGAATAAS